jgi:hypothetical protein
MALRLAVILLFLFTQNVFGQVESLEKWKGAYETLLEQAPLEIIHIHTDREHYTIGDTIWYKTYVLNGHKRGVSQISGIVYVELVDHLGKSVLTHRKHLIAGATAGYINFPKELTPGRYYLRGYTHYLLNFGEDFLFSKPIQIDGTFPTPFIVHIEELQLKENNNEYIGQSPLSIQLLNTKQAQIDPLVVSFHHKGRNFGSNILLTDSTNIDFRFPKTYDWEAITLNISNTDNQIEIPFQALMPKSPTDVQLLPESGQLIHNIPSSLGIKAIDQYGWGMEFEGFVYDLNHQIIDTFYSSYAGMGRIFLPHGPQNIGRISLTFANGNQQDLRLPNIAKEGIVLFLDSSSYRQNEFRLQIEASPQFQGQANYLIAMHKGQMVYSAILPKEPSKQRIALNKSSLPYGINELLIMDKSAQVLASRKVFNTYSPQKASIKLTTNAPYYTTNAPVDISIAVQDSNQRSSISHLSMAVTDDQQVEQSPYASNLLSTYFLQSEIKGHIENPGFYFSSHPMSIIALDHLMLTQGWVKYDHKYVSENRPLKIAPEKNFHITGKALNVMGKGLNDAKLIVIGTGNINFLLDTVADKNGKFYLEKELPLFAVPPKS